MNKNKKILFFCGGSYVYGKEKSILSIMMGLKTNGFSVHCVINGFNNGQWPKLLEQTGIPFTAIRLGKFSKSIKLLHLKWTLHALLHLPFALLKFRNILRKEKPNILFFDSHIPLFFLHSLIGDLPIIIRYAEYTSRDFFIRQLQKTSNFSNIHHVAISKFIETNIFKMGIAQNNITIIYNGFDQALGKNKKQGLFNLPLKVGFIGQITKGKGVEDIFYACGILADQKYSIKLIVAGSGKPSFLKYLKEIAKDKALDIEFLGYLDSIDIFYSQIDLCIVPTRISEAFGRVAAEAGLFHLPVIVSDRGGLPEIVIPDKTGFIVPSKDPVSLANKIEEFITKPEKIQEFGNRAYKHITSNFNSKDLVESYQDLIFHLLEDEY